MTRGVSSSEILADLSEKSIVSSEESLDTGDNAAVSGEKVSSKAWIITKRVMSPGVLSTFTDGFSNPWQGVGGQTKRHRQLAAQRNERSIKFEKFEDVLVENPEFEHTRRNAMRQLAIQLWLASAALICLVLWSTFLGFDVWPAPFALFNTMMPIPLGMVLISVIIARDFQYIAFKHCLVGLTFKQYFKLRIGYGIKSK